MSGFKSPNHTQVPNDFFDMIPNMSEAELRVTLIMIRETRGWHRDAAKVGKKEMADRSGLSFNGVTAGCEAAEKRGTFRRINPNTKTKAEWELIEEIEPSASEGDLDIDPQPVRDEPSASEGQVRLKKDKEKNLKKGDLVDGLLFFAQQGKERGEDQTEICLQEFESGLRRNIHRTPQWQSLAKWALKQGNHKAWIEWYMSDQFRASNSWRLTPEQIRNSWPQAQPVHDKGDNSQRLPEILT